MKNNKNKKKIDDENAVEMELINAEIRMRLNALIEKAQKNQLKKKHWLDILFNL